MWTETGIHKVSEFSEFATALPEVWDINERDEVVGSLLHLVKDENGLVIDGTYPHFIARPVNGLP